MSVSGCQMQLPWKETTKQKRFVADIAGVYCMCEADDELCHAVDFDETYSAEKQLVQSDDFFTRVSG